MQYCFYLDWHGMTRSEWAAWVQAVGSVLAILAAARLPLWHRRLELARQLNNYVAVLSVAESYAAADASLLQQCIDGLMPPGSGNAHWDPLISALRGIQYHELPDFRLFVPLQDALRDAQDCKAVLAEAIVAAESTRPVTAAMADRLRACRVRLNHSYQQAANVANKYGARTPAQLAKRLLLRLKSPIRPSSSQRSSA